AGLEIDNVLMEITGPEMPIIDGSSKPFIDILEKAGTVEQNAERIYYYLSENITFEDPSRKTEMLAVPSDDFRITVMVDYNTDILGTQHATLYNIGEFKKEVSESRTFCFLHELEMLLEHNLIKGGDVNNAIVVVDKPVTDEEMKNLARAFKREKIEIKSEGYLNNLELRFPNEPARHKLLDVVGDLALIGYPLKARIIANRPGHSSNVEFAKKIKQYIKKSKQNRGVPVYNPTVPPIYDQQYIEKVLPHRFPFALVDKIIEMTDTYIVGVKNVTFNEWFFQGHFPG